MEIQGGGLLMSKKGSPLAYQQEKSVCPQGFYGILFRYETRPLSVSG